VFLVGKSGLHLPRFFVFFFFFAQPNSPYFRLSLISKKSKPKIEHTFLFSSLSRPVQNAAVSDSRVEKKLQMPIVQFFPPTILAIEGK
jgi:hypothetical protein